MHTSGPTEPVVILDGLQALEYRSIGVGRRGQQRSLTNALVRVDALLPDGGSVFGLGEAQFRGAQTGDHGGRARAFLVESLHRLEGRELTVTDRATALESIRRMMADLAAVAAEQDHLDRRDSPRARDLRGIVKTAVQWARLSDNVGPFRGALFGIETALLDVAGRALDIPTSELLAGAPVDRHGPEVLAPLRILRSTADEAMAEITFSLAGTDPRPVLWLDLDARLRLPETLDLIGRLGRAATRGELPGRILVRRAVNVRDSYRLGAVRRAAQRFSTDGVAIEIVNDTVLSSGAVASRRIRGQVISVRPHALGGLVASLRQIGRIAEAGGRPYVVDVEAGGPIAHAAQLHLGAAARTAVPVVATPRDEASVLAGPGLGVPMPWEEIVDSVTDHVIVRPTATDTPAPGLSANTYREVPFLQPLGPNGTKGHLLEREALARGMSTIRFSKGAFVASDRRHEPLVFKWSRSPLSSAVALAMCTHKEATRIRLSRAGVPVPRGRTFGNGDLETARAFADHLGYPVVVKPAMGVRGIGVVAGIADRTELDLAFEQLTDSKLGDQDFIVEKHIPGKDYRIVVVGDRVIAAILREPASVIGDGVRSVAELLINKNAFRRLNPHLWGRPIMYDAAARYQLERIGMDLESVPAKGQHILLSNSCSLSQGGDSTDVLDELHPSIKQACVAAVQAIPGLAFCGVDFLLEDHTVPLDEQESGICELNAHAAIGNCEYPFFGTPREVARIFIDECVTRYGLDVAAEPASEVSLQLTIKGRTMGTNYAHWMRRNAREFGLAGWVRRINRRTLEAVISGETAAATALTAAAVLGPSRSKVTSVTTTHVTAPHRTTFTIVKNAPEELARV